MNAWPRTIWLFPWLEWFLHGRLLTLVAGIAAFHPLFNVFVSSRPPLHTTQLARPFILDSQGWVSCNLSKTSRLDVGITTLLPVSTNTSCTESLSLLLLKDCISYSYKAFRPVEWGSKLTTNVGPGLSTFLSFGHTLGDLAAFPSSRWAILGLELRRLTQ